MNKRPNRQQLAAIIALCHKRIKEPMSSAVADVVCDGAKVHQTAMAYNRGGDYAKPLEIPGLHRRAKEVELTWIKMNQIIMGMGDVSDCKNCK